MHFSLTNALKKDVIERIFTMDINEANPYYLSVAENLITLHMVPSN